MPTALASSVRLDPGTRRRESTPTPTGWRRSSPTCCRTRSSSRRVTPRSPSRIEERDGHRALTVRDHGPGIPRRISGRASFEKFAQADATDARQKGGTGLGLSIVRQIVTAPRRHGRFRGCRQAAARFSVWSCRPGPDRRARIDPTAAASARAARILLCEDDPDAALALREGLAVARVSASISRTRRPTPSRARRRRHTP